LEIAEKVEEPRSKRQISSHGDFRRYLYEAVVFPMPKPKTGDEKR